MISKDEDIEFKKQLINILDELLAAGDWNASLFLKVASKRISEIRDEAAKGIAKGVEKKKKSKQEEPRVKEGQIEVFISLYSAEGDQLSKWQAMVQTLSGSSISRPVYREEEHVLRSIRNKTKPEREAYVRVYIKEDHILKALKKEDRYGHELLTLREGAVALENVIEFVHQKQRYKVSNGRIIVQQAKGEVK